MKVSLFATCLGNEFFAEECADAVRLLRHLGAEIGVPERQTCCGQPAYNAGRRTEATRMARHTLGVFAESDYVVLPSGSCAGMMKCFYPDLLDGPSRSAASDLAERTFELSQFIVEVMGVTRLGEGLKGHRVAYHHGCHALRELGVRTQPIDLLRNAGATVLPWEADEECCGFGGLFSAKLPEVSAAMCDRKLDTLPSVDFVTSADGGCLMQLSGRAAHRRRPLPFRHLASVLWEAVG